MVVAEVGAKPIAVKVIRLETYTGIAHKTPVAYEAVEEAIELVIYEPERGRIRKPGCITLGRRSGSIRPDI